MTAVEAPSRDEILKHAQIVQNINSRLASHSAPNRRSAASITTAAAGAALAFHVPVIAWISIVAVVIFGLLDGYYLWQARLARLLYDAVIRGEVPYLQINLGDYRGQTRYWRAAVSTTVLAVYPPLAGVLVVAGLVA